LSAVDIITQLNNDKDTKSFSDNAPPSHAAGRLEQGLEQPAGTVAVVIVWQLEWYSQGFYTQ